MKIKKTDDLTATDEPKTFWRTVAQIPYTVPPEFSAEPEPFTAIGTFLTNLYTQLRTGKISFDAGKILFQETLHLSTNNLLSYKNEFCKDEAWLFELTINTTVLLATTLIKECCQGEDNNHTATLKAATFLTPYVFHETTDKGVIFYPQGYLSFGFRRNVQGAMGNGMALYFAMRDDLVCSQDFAWDLNENGIIGEESAYLQVERFSPENKPAITQKNQLPSDVYLSEKNGGKTLELPARDEFGNAYFYNWYTTPESLSLFTVEQQHGGVAVLKLPAGMIILQDQQVDIILTSADVFGNAIAQTVHVHIVNDVNEKPTPKITGTKKSATGKQATVKLTNFTTMEVNPQDNNHKLTWQAVLDGRLITKQEGGEAFAFDIPDFIGDKGTVVVTLTVDDLHDNNNLGTATHKISVTNNHDSSLADPRAWQNNLEYRELQMALGPNVEVISIPTKPDKKPEATERAFDVFVTQSLTLPTPTKFYDLVIFADQSGSMYIFFDLLAEQYEEVVNSMISQTDPDGKIRISFVGYGDEVTEVIWQSDVVYIDKFEHGEELEQFKTDVKYYAGETANNIREASRNQETLFYSLWDIVAGPSQSELGDLGWDGENEGTIRFVAITDYAVEEKENVVAVDGDPSFDKDDAVAFLTKNDIKLSIIRVDEETPASSITTLPFKPSKPLPDLIQDFQTKPNDATLSEICKIIFYFPENQTMASLDFLINVALPYIQKNNWQYRKDITVMNGPVFDFDSALVSFEENLSDHSEIFAPAFELLLMGGDLNEPVERFFATNAEALEKNTKIMATLEAWLDDNNKEKQAMALACFTGLGERLADHPDIVKKIFAISADKGFRPQSLTAYKTLAAMGPRIVEYPKIMSAIITENLYPGGRLVRLKLDKRVLDSPEALEVLIRAIDSDDDYIGNDYNGFNFDFLVQLSPQIADHPDLVRAIARGIVRNSPLAAANHYGQALAKLGSRLSEFPDVVANLKKAVIAANNYHAAMALTTLGEDILQDAEFKTALIKMYRNAYLLVYKSASQASSISFGKGLLNHPDLLAEIVSQVTAATFNNFDFVEAFETADPALLAYPPLTTALLKKLSPTYTDSMIDGFGTDDIPISNAAKKALSRVGPQLADQPEAMVLLTSYLQTEDPFLAQQALEVLQGLGPRLSDFPATREKITVRLLFLNQFGILYNQPQAAAIALANMGEAFSQKHPKDADRAQGVLVNFIADTNTKDFETIIDGVTLNPQFDPAITDAIVAILGHPNLDARINAAKFLGKLGYKPALPYLEAMAKLDAMPAQRAAKAAMAQIQGAGQ